jgi:hypothetical protein
VLLVESLVFLLMVTSCPPCRSLNRPFVLLPTTCPLCCSLNRSFLSLPGDLPTAPRAASLVSLTPRGLARRAIRCITHCFLSPTSCPSRRALNRSFLSLADDLPAVPLAGSLVASTRRRLARRAARCIARLFLLTTLPAAPFAVSLLALSRRRLARRAARGIARFFRLPTTCPPCRLLNHSFLSPAGNTPAAPLA